MERIHPEGPWMELGPNLTSKPFPFKQPGALEQKQIARLCGRLNPIEQKLLSGVGISQMRAVANMFDSETEYKLSAFHAVQAVNPQASCDIAAKWGISPELMKTTNITYDNLNTLLSWPEEPTIRDVDSWLPDTIAPLRAFIISELTAIATKAEQPDTKRLMRLARISDLVFANKNDVWNKNRSSCAELSAMIGCLKDVVFWAEHPETFAVMSQIVYETTSVPPESRYQYEKLTNFFAYQLIHDNIITKDDIAKGKLRIIGNLKPVSRALKSDLEDPQFESIVRETAEKMHIPANTDLYTLLDMIFRDINPQNTRTVTDLMIQMNHKRFVGYDQRRCRIHVANAKTYNRVVYRLHHRLKTIEYRIRLAQRNHPEKKLTLFNLEDYMRMSIYNNKTSSREKILFAELGTSPSEAVLSHFGNIKSGDLVYAAYHQHSPLFNKKWGIIPIPSMNAEFQVTLGARAMEQMNKMAALAYDTDGDYGKAGLTTDYVNVLDSRAQEEARLIKEGGGEFPGFADTMKKGSLFPLTFIRQLAGIQ